MLLPIIMILVCVLLGGGTLLFLKFSEKRKKAKSRDTIPCTQELVTILKRGPETLHDFDGELFGQLIDKVIIESNTSLRFRLKNGLELRESIERTVR